MTPRTSGTSPTYLAYDVLQRRLRDLGHETRCVRNVTDVDDDLLRKARSLDVHYLDLAAEQTAYFDEQMAALGMLPSFSEPRATSAISDILRFIGQLFDGGSCVPVRRRRLLQRCLVPGIWRAQPLRPARRCSSSPPNAVGIRATPTSRIRSTSSCGSPRSPDEPAWESQWGPGRPGWHIECSALARPRARQHDRHSRRRLRPRLSPSRVRAGTVRKRQRLPFRPSLDARRHGPARGREDVEVTREPRLRRRPLEGT